MHAETHSHTPTLIKDLVLGVSDGLTVPFALAAGLSGIVTSNHIVITAGLAEIAAGAIAMGLGGYLAGRHEVDHYEGERKREINEIATVPEIEKQEVRDILHRYGISRKTQDNLVDELSKDHDQWIDFMMRFELGLETPERFLATKSGCRIGSSYVVGGIIPLSPYFFINVPLTALLYSAIVTGCCLFLFGYLKCRLTGQKASMGALRTTLIGGVAAGAAYLVAKFVGGS